MTEQYSNLNVHGKIKQLESQANRTPDSAEVVRYDTLTGRVPATLPTPAAANEGKAIISNGSGFEFGEAGKVDAVQINGTAIAGDGAQTKIANIVPGTGLTNSGATINHSNSVTAETTGKGSATAIPIIKYDAQGHITSVTTATVYPPTSAGTSGYVWKSDGSGVAQWSQLAGTAPITVTNTSATKTTITHDNSGVTAGTYKSVTVNATGHVTAGTNPTTLSGYGITDAVQHNSTTASQVYATNGSKVDTPVSYSTGATQGHIVQRGTGGQITVPSTPSADTDAASKAFVNSSVGTNTATFRGTYNAVSDLGNTQATVDTWADPPTSAVETLVTGQIATKLASLSVTPENNDYVFVSVDQTPVGDLGEDWYWRFKYSDPNNDHTGSWGYEYTLNNSSFTQAQWDAVNSGITDTKVGTYDTHVANSEIHVPTQTTANKVLLSTTSTNAPAWSSGALSSSDTKPLKLNSSGVLTPVANTLATASQLTDGSVTKLGTSTVGAALSNNTFKPIYWNAGVPGEGPQLYNNKVKIDGASTPSTIITSGTSALDLASSAHTHATSIASGGSSPTALSANTTYTLSAGGTSVVFTTPANQTIKQDGITGATVTRYASCTTGALTAEKKANVTDGTFTLETGARVTVNFSYRNTASSPTLNINSTGAKDIYFDGTRIVAGTWRNMLYGVCDFVYDGTQWHLVGNSPYQVKQEDTSSSNDLPLLFSASAINTVTTTTSTVKRCDIVYANPSVGRITASGGFSSDTAWTTEGVKIDPKATGYEIYGGTTSKKLIVNEDYTLAAACAKAVTDSSSASAIGTGTSLPTERDIYYGLPTINNSHAYTSSTTIYAPSGAGTANQILKSSGGTNAPVWADITSLMPIAATDVTLADM